MEIYLVEVTIHDGPNHARLFKACGSEEIAINRLSAMIEKKLADTSIDKSVFVDRPIELHDGEELHDAVSIKNKSKSYILEYDITKMTVEE